MSWNAALTLIALAALLICIGRKEMATRDLLLVLSTACTVVFLIIESFYVGFVNGEKSRGPIAYLFNLLLQSWAQAAFVMGIISVIFSIFPIDQERRNAALLSDFIDVYELHTSIEWMPRVDNTVIGRRILRTVDDATSVMEHYEQIAVRDGWEVESHAPPDFAISRRLVFG